VHAPFVVNLFDEVWQPGGYLAEFLITCQIDLFTLNVFMKLSACAFW
jgi:hypothetical protein